MRTARSRLVVAAATFLSLTLLTAACGSDDAATEPTPTAPADAPATAPDDADAFPVTVEIGGEPFTLDARPERIVSLSPSTTEGLFAVGAGGQVVAVDEYSDFPAEAPTSELSGFTPNVEAIVGYAPDLVIVSYDPGDLVASLRATGIPVLIVPAASVIEESFAQLTLLGAITGNRAGAEALVADLTARLEAAFASVPAREAPLTYFHELDDTLFTVTSATFVGDVYARFGLLNVADAADPDGTSFGYPQLSAEFLLAADPDLVFLADTRCCAVDAASFAARPGFAQLSAVVEGRVFALDDDISSRWGPRIVDFVEQIAAAVRSLDAASSGTSSDS
jgi:iron complex transport system substrate-binding protein